MVGRPYSVFNSTDGRAFTLRELRRSDLAALVRFANKIASEKRRNPDLGIVSLEKRATTADEKKFLDRTLEGLAKKRYVSVAAFQDGILVGNCDILGRTLTDVRHTGVLGIVLLEDCRGVGLGEAMIRKALGRAEELGIWAVELEVFATNARARALYRKIGFRECGVIPSKMQRNGRFIDSVQMYIHLLHK
jgi:ribosomal protein S18 acetylase RimI-like enzyme